MWGASRARDPWEPTWMRLPRPSGKDVLVYRRELCHHASLQSQSAGLGPFYLLAETERMVTMTLLSLVRNSRKSSPRDPGQINTTQPAKPPRCTEQQLQAHAACLLTCLFYSSWQKSNVSWRYGTQSQTQVFPRAQDGWGLAHSRRSFGN